MVEGPALDARRCRASVALGILSALVVVTKMLAFLLVAFLPLLLKTWRQRACFFIAAILTGAVSLLPVYSRMGAIVKWIFANFTHSGIYGAGQAGFINPSTYFPNLVLALFPHPALFLVLGIALMAIIMPAFVSVDSSARQLRPALLALVLGSVLSVLVIAKWPVSHYLILPLALSGLIFYLSVRYIGRCFPWRKKQIQAAALLMAFVFVAGSQASIYHQYIALKNRASTDLQARDYVNGCARSMPLVTAYASSSPTCALAFGNSTAGYIYTYILRNLYPGAYDYDVFGNHLSRFDSVTNQGDLPNLSGKVLLEGSALTDQAAGNVAVILFSKAAVSRQKQIGDDKIYVLSRQ
jgi:hypothetical protein